MGLSQMLIVILATVLFSTLIIGIYNNMSNQIEMSQNYQLLTQGLKIADAQFQEIEAKLLGRKIAFESLITTYNIIDPDTFYVNLENTNTRYGVSLRAEYCQPNGDTPAPVGDHILVRCLIHIIANNGHKTLDVGVEDAHFRKVYPRLNS